jgi:hypothetical protein
MTTHNNTCRAEAAIMQRMNDAIREDEEPLLGHFKKRIIKYKDHFLFRNHYVRLLHPLMI